ncbi:hypothetical protein GALMADRAFT_139062 [Galerina marginata CBS 339.88]|uniref:Uncharacterized protein n=1 Tax=Galerina marginata (strain CBS 339.88) TaxID=685588 RepID=A0A067T3Z4_GALM3|nr:hypothetical protein GALMADRAFT_139062 [Galerina marginata CBS 339.88]
MSSMALRGKPRSRDSYKSSSSSSARRLSIQPADAQHPAAAAIPTQTRDLDVPMSMSSLAATHHYLLDSQFTIPASYSSLAAVYIYAWSKPAQSTPPSHSRSHSTDTAIDYSVERIHGGQQGNAYIRHRRAEIDGTIWEPFEVNGEHHHITTISQICNSKVMKRKGKVDASTTNHEKSPKIAKIESRVFQKVLLEEFGSSSPQRSVLQDRCSFAKLRSICKEFRIPTSKSGGVKRPTSVKRDYVEAILQRLNEVLKGVEVSSFDMAEAQNILSRQSQTLSEPSVALPGLGPDRGYMEMDVRADSGPRSVEQLTLKQCEVVCSKS